MSILIENSPIDDIFRIKELCIERLRPYQLQQLNNLVRKHTGLIEGDFYLRSISENGVDFAFPNQHNSESIEVIAWSRIDKGREIVCAFNLAQQHEIVYVTIDNLIHPLDSSMQCLYASDLSPAVLNVEVRNGKAIRLSIPPNGLVIYG